jgi:pimeloyl-ACP methyl ester carboxylesterase
VSLAADMTPSKLPILFLHGSAETFACWDAILVHTDPSLVVTRSDELVSPASVLSYAEVLEHDIQLIGHSYGGVLALMLALARPERIRRLTLIEPVVFRLLEGRDEAALAPVRRAHLGFANFGPDRMEQGLAGLLDYWFGPGSWDQAPQKLRELMFRDGQTIRDQMEHAATYRPPEDQIEALNIPTTLIAGSATQASARSTVRVLEQLLPDARRFEVAGARHNLIHTHPEQLAALLGIAKSG